MTGWECGAGGWGVECKYAFVGFKNGNRGQDLFFRISLLILYWALIHYSVKQAIKKAQLPACGSIVPCQSTVRLRTVQGPEIFWNDRTEWNDPSCDAL